jgi:hypothetical protein
MTFQILLPSGLQPVGDAVLRSLLPSDRHLFPNGITVLVHGEVLAFPSRLHCPRDRLQDTVDHSTGDARRLALCLGTRHHDGHVREACLRQIGAMDPPWVIPFVVQLLGEYVVEITEVAAEAIARADPIELAAFVAGNPRFMATTRRRVVSYWDCYYRDRWSVVTAYPAMAALKAIERIASDEAMSAGAKSQSGLLAQSSEPPSS